MRFFAVAAPGLEGVLRDELAAIVGEARVVEGGVEWDGDLASAMRANLWSRIATRVVARVGEVRARDFAALRDGVARLDWRAWTTGPSEVVCSVTARKSRLYHTGAIAERVEAGVRDAVPGSGGPPLSLLVRGIEDVFTVSVDTSGELLHRRGWRSEQGEAPLRETLAAGMLALAGWKPGEVVVDPLCGSGTIAIEAALWSAGRPPGAGRSFAFPLPAGMSAEIKATRDHPPAAAVGGGAISHASDKDAAMVDLARRNAVRAGVDITFTVAPLRDVRLPDGPAGWIVTNPPYGHRLGDVRQLTPLYRELGNLRRQRPGWRLAFITPSGKLAAAAGRATRVHPLTTGGLRVQLYVIA